MRKPTNLARRKEGKEKPTPQNTTTATTTTAKMSEAFERERQNNARLDELSAKVSALRGVTIDIYDSARSQEVIESTVRPPPPLLPQPAPFSRPPYTNIKERKGEKKRKEKQLANLARTQSETFSSMTTQIKGSASRLGRMAASGNKVAVFKLSGIIIGVVLVLYYIWRLFF